MHFLSLYAYVPKFVRKLFKGKINVCLKNKCRTFHTHLFEID